MRPLHVVAVALAAATIAGAQAPKPERDWAAHGHDTGAQRYSPLKQINTANVSNLQLALDIRHACRRGAICHLEAAVHPRTRTSRTPLPPAGGQIQRLRGARASGATTIGGHAARGQ